MNAILNICDPVTKTTLHRDDGTIEYHLRAPTAGALAEPLRRIKASFQRSDIVIGQPVMEDGDVTVSVTVYR